ncbi:hypothetical protein AVEN_77591-1 [Araneus ventricosus]|uniref:Uncharacterized protein n=1 Tax=Araneus ventricosus TaxID=182803 RepID=A0A4Y2KBB6_ARAVE|nr:hypothetical protein AVEN_77591-1 [Araneus ventricosus]
MSRGQAAGQHKYWHPSPSFRIKPAGGRLAATYHTTGSRHGGSSGNWVLNLEPSGPEAETLPLGHCGPFHKSKSIAYIYIPLFLSILKSSVEATGGYGKISEQFWAGDFYCLNTT